MISIKKYLDSGTHEMGKRSDSPVRDAFALALDAYGSTLVEMGNCSLDACPGTGESLKGALVQLTAELTPAVSPTQLKATGEAAKEQLRSWGSATARHYQERAHEVKEILLTMARTAESVSARDQRCAGQMNAVTQRLKTIATLDDLTQVRVSIVESTVELKASIERMTEEGKRVLDHLRKQVQDYQTKLEEAEKIASRDALTGISNRVYVEARIEERLTSNSEFCVAILDLDGFKKVNDEHGHLAGDELLKQFAGELRSACRSTDVIGRWGGDEFILLLDAGLEEAQGQVDRIRKWVCGNYEIRRADSTIKFRVNASIGLAAHNEGETIKDLLARADAAMYEQKAASRTRAA